MVVHIYHISCTCGVQQLRGSTGLLPWKQKWLHVRLSCDPEKPEFASTISARPEPPNRARAGPDGPGPENKCILTREMERAGPGGPGPGNNRASAGPRWARPWGQSGEGRAGVG
jgi:hypothetical protein